MKKFGIGVAAVALCAAALSVSPARADHHMAEDNHHMADDNMMMSDMMKNSAMHFAFYNLDQREMTRLKAKGFSDNDIKMAANIAMRTGLSMDYVLRRYQVSGLPLPEVAAMYGVSVSSLNDDIPGMYMDKM